MRFNLKELTSVALQPSHKFDKEGVLQVREKQGSYFKRADVFTERWCRLRGNLLFYFKTKDQCSEPLGVIVLEQCVVKLEECSEHPHQFSLEFDGDEKIQQLIAQSESERDSWIQVLHMASYEYMRSQLENLQGKLASRCGKTSPSDTSSISSETDLLSKRLRSKASACESGEWLASLEPFLEINISCDNLMCDGDGTQPNPMVMMFALTPPQTQWMKYNQTEIVERSSNPCFLTTFGLSRSDIQMSTRIKFSVYNILERLTSTMTLLGQSVTTVSNLLLTGRSKLRLTLISAECAGVGFISITARHVESDTQSISSYVVGGNYTPKNASPPEEAKVAENRPRSQSLPSKLLSNWKLDIGMIPPSLQLEILFDNAVVQCYRFHTGLGADLSVQETMAESRMSSILPRMLLKFWIKEEKQCMENVTCVGNLKPEWEARQIDALERHLDLVKAYTQACDYLQSNWSESGCHYKKSSDKGDIKLEFMPVNLHIQRLSVRNVSTRKHGVYDIFTVGAFTAISRKFKNGGLYSMLNHLSKSPSFNGTRWALGEDADALGIMSESVITLKKLRKRLLVCVEALVNHAGNKSISGMQAVMNTICDLANNMMCCCNGDLVDCAMVILEQARIPDKSKPINQLMESREGTPARLIKSVDDGKLSSSGVVVTKPNSLALNDVKLPLANGYPLNLNGGINVNFESKLDIKLQDCSAEDNSIPVSCSRNNPESHSHDENCKNGNRCKSDVSTILNNSAAYELKRANDCVSSDNLATKCNIDGTIPLNDENVDVDPTELASILSSDVFSSKSSPLEPEPLDLTKLNVEASVMCMLSKTNSFAQHPHKNFLTELLPSIRKLKHAVDGLLHTIRVANGVYALMETQHRSNERYSVRHRRDIVLCHALTSIVTGLMTRLWCTSPIDHNFLNRLLVAGVLVQFEGMLTCHGDELGMLEDMIIAVSDLENISFQLECINDDVESLSEPKIEGSRLNMTVIIPVKHEIYLALPNQLQSSGTFKIVPVFFNVGINEQATIAEKFGDLSLQEFINKHNSEKLNNYFNKYQNTPVTRSVRGRRYNIQDIPVTELLNRLKTQVTSKKNKNVEVLHLAAEICHRLGGLRFTSCKSAKDRTSMSVTLEQCRLLQKDFDLDEREFIRALNCMRSEGVRRENTLKNAGVRKYAFNSLQLMTLPKLYRPPPGTFGNVQT